MSTHAPDAARAERRGAAPQVADRVLIMCALSWGAALLHVRAAIDHVDEHVIHAVLFELLATAQLLWGVAVYRRQTPRLLLAGAVLSMIVVTVWALSRSSGLPIGPGAWRPEPVGVNDAIATADEVVLSVLVLLGLRFESAGGPVARTASFVAAVGVCLVLVSSLAFTLGGHAHG